VEATAYCLVYRPKPRFVISGDDQLELRRELEKILSHKSRGDFVAAGERLDPGLGPASTFLSFDGRNQPRAARSSQVGWVPVGRRRSERLDGRGPVILAKDSRNSVYEDALAVRA